MKLFSWLRNWRKPLFWALVIAGIVAYLAATVVAYTVAGPVAVAAALWLPMVGLAMPELMKIPGWINHLGGRTKWAVLGHQTLFGALLALMTVFGLAMTFMAFMLLGPVGTLADPLLGFAFVSFFSALFVHLSEPVPIRAPEIADFPLGDVIPELA